MINPFKKKKTSEQIEVDKAAEEVRFKAETERRLELAKEHGIADANKKYGKFKQPSMLSNISKTIGTAAANSQSTPSKKKKGPGASERMEKMFDQLEKM